MSEDYSFARTAIESRDLWKDATSTGLAVSKFDTPNQVAENGGYKVVNKVIRTPAIGFSSQQRDSDVLGLTNLVDATRLDSHFQIVSRTEETVRVSSERNR